MSGEPLPPKVAEALAGGPPLTGAELERVAREGLRRGAARNSGGVGVGVRVKWNSKTRRPNGAEVRVTGTF